MKKRRSMFIIPGVVLPLLYVLGCNQPTLKSVWREAGGNGGTAAPGTSLSYSIEGKNLDVGLQNDDDNLYITLKAEDRQTGMKIMRLGLIVWLDRTAKKRKTFGIRYPMGFRLGEGALFAGRPEGERDIRPRRGFGGMLDTLEILGPGEHDTTMLPTRNEVGLFASFNDSMGAAIYYLTVPLEKTDNTPYAISAGAGNIVGLGLETGELNRDMMRMRPRGREDKPEGGDDGMEGGGFSGRGGGFGGRGGFGGHGGRMREGEGSQNWESIKFWAKVQVASEGPKEASPERQ